MLGVSVTLKTCRKMCIVCESGGDGVGEMRGEIEAGEGEEMERKRQRGRGEEDEHLLMSF